jgi:hypothetical protein
MKGMIKAVVHRDHDEPDIYYSLSFVHVRNTSFKRDIYIYIYIYI